MKIMLPIENRETGNEILARGFHNARYVCIYDCQSKQVEWIPAKAISSDLGDFTHGLQRLGVSAVISSYLPPMTLQIFARNGLAVYKARGTEVEENIHFFNRSQLELYAAEEARQMWDCNSGCSSCTSKSCA